MPAELIDASRINVRAADCREIWRTSMSTPQKAIERAITASRDAFTGTLDGEIICIVGVATSSVINRVGTPWLLGSELIRKEPFEFLDKSKTYIETLREGYDLLENYVDVDNKISIRWLKWLGFNVEKEARPYGVIGKPFRRFEMR